MSQEATPAARTSLGLIDKAAFFLVFVVGALVIVAVDALDASKWWAVGVCGVLMLGYAALALAAPALRLRADQAADNLYYLGLLFTLTSLGVALARFAGAGLETGSILRNFGIAIFTTIFGLALRVVVGQFRDDPEDLEQEARLALSEGVRRMRGQLDQAAAELRSFADGMRQVVGEFAEAAGSAAGPAMESSVARFEAAAEGMGSRFEEASARLNARTLELEAALGSLTARLEGVRADPATVERALTPAIDAIARAGGAFAETLDRERARYATTAQTVAQLAVATQQLSGSSRSLQIVAERLEGAGASLTQASALIERLEAASTGAATATERLQESFARAGASLEREFAGSSATIERVRRELTELAAWIIERLDRR